LRIAGVAALFVAILAGVYLIARRTAPAPSSALPRTLAVLPFRAISAEGMPEHFGLGLADSLIGRLASLRELTVRPTSAIARYETATSDASEIGRRLGVDAVLEGTYQKLEGMTRVSVQMTDVSRGGILWSDRIDLPAGKLFELQDTISRQVAERLQLELAPSLKRTIGPAQTVPDRVLEQYLASRAKLSRIPSSDASVREEVVRSFDSILAEQPDFAAAVGARAYARAWLSFLRPEVDRYQAVLSDCDRALALDPELVEPRVARASVAWSALGGWDVVTAVRELKTALSKSPGLDIAYFDLARIYAHNGWADEFNAAIRAGEAINPSGEGDRQRATYSVWIEGDPKKARNTYRQLPREMQGLWAVRWPEDWLGGLLDEPASIEAHIRSEQSRAPEDLKPAYSAILAILLARQGKSFDHVEQEILASDTRMGHFHHVFHNLAQAHAFRGEGPAAVRMLERAGETGFPCGRCFDADPVLAPIRGGDGYASVRREMDRRTRGYRAALKDVL
jgi:TolB-like protein